jgi:hypothetical protein
VALRAGTKHAAKATAASSAEIPANVIGSVGFTSNSIVCKNRVRASEPAKPEAKPEATISAPSPTAIFNMSPRCAPIAMRIPISFVRWLNVYAITP